MYAILNKEVQGIPFSSTITKWAILLNTKLGTCAIYVRASPKKGQYG